MTPGLPEPLFAAGSGRSVLADFNVSSDGLRFCQVVPTDDDGEQDQPVVVLNWFKELAEKVPSTD